VWDDSALTSKVTEETPSSILVSHRVHRELREPAGLGREMNGVRRNGKKEKDTIATDKAATS